MNPIIALSVFLIGTGIIIPPYEHEFDLWDKTCQMVQNVYPCGELKKPEIKDSPQKNPKTTMVGIMVVILSTSIPQ